MNGVGENGDGDFQASVGTLRHFDLWLRDGQLSIWFEQPDGLIQGRAVPSEHGCVEPPPGIAFRGRGKSFRGDLHHTVCGKGDRSRLHRSRSTVEPPPTVLHNAFDRPQRIVDHSGDELIAPPPHDDLYRLAGRQRNGRRGGWDHTCHPNQYHPSCARRRSFSSGKSSLMIGVDGCGAKRRIGDGSRLRQPEFPDILGFKRRAAVRDSNQEPSLASRRILHGQSAFPPRHVAKEAGLLAAGAGLPLMSASGAEPQREAMFLPSLYDRGSWPFIAWWSIATNRGPICRISIRE